jgi:hypothetical protein
LTTYKNIRQKARRRRLMQTNNLDLSDTLDMQIRIVDKYGNGIELSRVEDGGLLLVKLVGIAEGTASGAQILISESQARRLGEAVYRLLGSEN